MLVTQWDETLNDFVTIDVPDTEIQQAQADQDARGQVPVADGGTWPGDEPPPEETEQTPQPEVKTYQYWDANSGRWQDTQMTKEQIDQANKTTPMLYKVDGQVLSKPDELAPLPGQERTEYASNMPAVLPPELQKQPVIETKTPITENYTKEVYENDIKKLADILSQDMMPQIGSPDYFLMQDTANRIQQQYQIEKAYADRNNLVALGGGKYFTAEQYQQYLSNIETSAENKMLVGAIESQGGITTAIQTGNIDIVRKAIDAGLYNITDKDGQSRQMNQLDLVGMQAAVADKNSQEWALNNIRSAAPFSMTGEGVDIKRALSDGVDASVLRLAGFPSDRVEQYRAELEREAINKGKIDNIAVASKLLGIPEVTIGPADPEKSKGIFGLFTPGYERALFGQRGPVAEGLVKLERLSKGGDSSLDYLRGQGINPITRENMNAPFIGNLMSVEAAKEAGYNPSVKDWTVASVLTAAQLIPFFVRGSGGSISVKYAPVNDLTLVGKGMEKGIPVVRGVGQIKTLENQLINVPIEQSGGEAFASGIARSTIDKLPVIWEKGAPSYVVMGENGQPFRIPVSSLESFGKPIKVIYEETGGVYKPYYTIGQQKIPISPEINPNLPPGGGTTLTIPKIVAPSGTAQAVASPATVTAGRVSMPIPIGGFSVQPATTPIPGEAPTPGRIIPAIAPQVIPSTSPIPATTPITTTQTQPVTITTPETTPRTAPGTMPQTATSSQPITTTTTETITVPTTETVTTPVTETPVITETNAPPSMQPNIPQRISPPQRTPIILPPSISGRPYRGGDYGGYAVNTFLSGQVIDKESLTPIYKALVTLVSATTGSKAEKRTDKTGRYRFVEVEPDIYNVSTQIEGYDDVRVRLAVNPGENKLDLKPSQRRTTFTTIREPAPPPVVKAQPKVVAAKPPQRVIAVERGVTWIVIYPPYKKHNIVHMRIPPSDAVQLAKLGSAFKMIAQMGGDPNVLLSLNYGAFNVEKDRSMVNNRTLKFKKKRNVKRQRKAIMIRR